jgi:target of rapamycin complex subunit LST8
MSVVLATAGLDHKIRFWEAPSGICSRMIKYPDSQINRLEITPDKQFLAAAGNPVIRLYEIAAPPANSSSNPPDATQAVLTLEGHTSNVTAIGFQRDGRYLYSGSEDGTIKVWDLRNPHYSRSFDSGSGVNAVTLRTDRDELISGDQHGCLKVWDLGGSGCINSVRPTASGAQCNHITPVTATTTGSTTASNNGTTANNSSHHPTSRYTSTEGSVPLQAVDISEDSRTLVAVSNHGTVFVWDASGSAASPLHSNNNNNSHPSLLDEIDRDEMSSMSSLSPPWDADRLLQPVTKFLVHPEPGSYCLQARLAPDGRHLVTTSSDGLARMWDTATWTLTQTLPSAQWVWDAAFCADSSYLVTASSDHVARLWNLRTGAVVRQYHGHQATVTCVALNDSSV